MQVRFAPMQISNLSMASSPPMVWKPAQERYHHHQHCLRSLPGAHLHLSRMFSNAASNRQLLISYLRYHKWTWTEFSFLSEHGLGHLYAILKGQWLNVMYIVFYHVLDCWYLGNPKWPIIQGTTSNPFLFISVVQHGYSRNIILRNIRHH